MHVSWLIWYDFKCMCAYYEIIVTISPITLVKKQWQLIAMYKKLPKHFEVTLDSLLSGSILSSWSTHGNWNLITLTLRFKVVPEEKALHEESFTDSVKFKCVPVSQLKRDSARAGEYKDKLHRDESLSPKDNPKETLDTSRSRPLTKPYAVSAPPHNTNMSAPSDNTRGKTRSRSNSTTKPGLYVCLSPIPQVDGGHDCTAKQDCDDSSHASDSQECSGRNEDMPDWVKAFINLSIVKLDVILT